MTLENIVSTNLIEVAKTVGNEPHVINRLPYI